MTKPEKTPKSQSPFERFESLTKALVSVPKKELDQKLAQYKRSRAKKH